MSEVNGQVRKLHATGFVVLDLLLSDGLVTPAVGGTAANVAINMALLGGDTSVTALLGDDDAGHLIRSQLEMFGVNTAGIRNDPEVETPVLIHEVGPRGHRFKFSCPACGTKYAKFRPLPPAFSADAPEADFHFFDRASAYAVAVAHAEKGSTALVFEPGTPGRPSATSDLAHTADILRAADGLELSPIGSASSKQIQVVGLGKRGVRYRSFGGSKWGELPSRLKGALVDAGGAGDWLTAGMLSSLDPERTLKGEVSTEELEQAVSVGLDFAAACCRHIGTRGAVGTADWRELVAAHGFHVPAVDTRRLAGSMEPATTCRSWFHQLHR